MNVSGNCAETFEKVVYVTSAVKIKSSFLLTQGYKTMHAKYLCLAKSIEVWIGSNGPQICPAPLPETGLVAGLQISVLSLCVSIKIKIRRTISVWLCNPRAAMNFSW